MDVTKECLRYWQCWRCQPRQAFPSVHTLEELVSASTCDISQSSTTHYSLPPGTMFLWNSPTIFMNTSLILPWFVELVIFVPQYLVILLSSKRTPSKFIVSLMALFGKDSLGRENHSITRLSDYFLVASLIFICFSSFLIELGFSFQSLPISPGEYLRDCTTPLHKLLTKYCWETSVKATLEPLNT